MKSTEDEAAPEFTPIPTPNLKAHTSIPVPSLTYREEGEERTVSLYGSGRGHLLLVLISTSCEPCLGALEALDDRLAESLELNVLLGIEGSKDDFLTIRSAFVNRAFVIPLPIEQMISQLQSTAMPWGYLIDEEGLILTSGPFHTPEGLDKLCAPLASSSKENAI